jgi:hypothetical protein
MPDLTTRPRFVFWTAFVRQLPLQLFFTVWSGIFFGGFFGFLQLNAALLRGRMGGGDILSIVSGPAAIGTVTFLAFPILTIGARYMNYANTRYTIGDRFIDVEEGFFTTQKKRLAVADIREVSVRRGILQRLSGVGSVYVATLAQGGTWRFSGSPIVGATSMTGSGAMLMDLTDWARVYDELQRRLEGRAGQVR